MPYASVSLVTVDTTAQADTKSGQQLIVSIHSYGCVTDDDENTEHPEITAADLLQFPARSVSNLCTA